MAARVVVVTFDAGAGEAIQRLCIKARHGRNFRRCMVRILAFYSVTPDQSKREDLLGSLGSQIAWQQL